jgi:hypothetical protein
MGVVFGLFAFFSTIWLIIPKPGNIKI